MLLHAAWRSVLLTFLGVFLRSSGRLQTNFTFEDTLSQIGLGYIFLFSSRISADSLADCRGRGHSGRLLGGLRRASAAGTGFQVQ
jgi:hypothetical protein